jgi:hypothetical protein
MCDERGLARILPPLILLLDRLLGLCAGRAQEGTGRDGVWEMEMEGDEMEWTERRCDAVRREGMQ